MIEVSKIPFREDGCFHDNCRALARLHRQGSPQDLLSRLGEGFLGNFFYPNLLRLSDTILSVAKNEDRWVGFLIATADSQKLLKKILARSPLAFLTRGLTALLVRPRLWKMVWQAIHLKSPESSPEGAEIVMVTVESSCRGMGFGRRLLDSLEVELRKRKISFCLARVRVENSSAMKMYLRSGFQEIGSVRFQHTLWKWMRHDTVF